MSNTFKHKINTKYRLGLIEKVPISIQKYWNRINFDKGEFLALRAKKKEQILDTEMNNQLINNIMQEETIVRENLMTEQNYSPYCGNNKSFRSIGGCYNPRVKWIPELNQFKCPNCGWVSEFPEDFIKRYKARWFLQ